MLVSGVRRDAQRPGALWQGAGRERRSGTGRWRAGRVRRWRDGSGWSRRRPRGSARGRSRTSSEVPGGLDDQPGAAPRRPAEGRPSAGARRGLPPRAAPVARPPRARPLRARAYSPGLDAGADVTGAARSAGSVGCRPRRSTPSSTARGKKAGSSGRCCRAGEPGAGGGEPLSRAPPAPGPARSTTGPRPLRSARTRGTGRATSRSVGGSGRCWSSRSAEVGLHPARHAAAGNSAAETVAVRVAVLCRLDPRLRPSTTFDDDTAFSRHGLLASARAMTNSFPCPEIMGPGRASVTSAAGPGARCPTVSPRRAA